VGVGRLIAEGVLEIAAGDERVRLDGFTADMGEPAGAEVLVYFDPPDRATLHVYGREIADGDLSCTLGARRAAVKMDVALLAAILTAALDTGLALPPEEARALAAALAAA
jgi:hypothetical protein